MSVEPEDNLLRDAIRWSLALAKMDFRRCHENAKALWLGIEESEWLTKE